MSGMVDKSYVCSFCGQAFKRNDHLRRHKNLHTRQEKYGCVCGETFVRKDVLAQHLRSCQLFQDQSGKEAGRVRVRATRIKKACDRCANAKVKCDSQDPCARCRAKSWTCEYTREGYVDPYQEYRVTDDNPVNSGGSLSDTPITPTSLEFVSDNAIHMESMDTAPVFDNVQPTLPQEGGFVMPASEILPNATASMSQLPVDTIDLDHLNLDNLPTDFNFDLYDDTSGYLNASSWFLEPLGMVGQPMIDTNFFELVAEPPNPIEAVQHTHSLRRGFSLEQSDPVEAKCTEIRALLQPSNSDSPEDSGTSSLTRTKIQLCHQLYGTHFQYHFPILHSATHKFTEASPLLLAAMTLAGAHYSSSIMTPAEISTFALRLLMVVQTQPCEMALEAPDMSTLQACVIICALLACSRDPIANQSWPIHFSRIISMSERMAVFHAEDQPDYRSLTLHTFDWPTWVERESQRRLACQVYCQDMAGCVFLGRRPALSPLSIDVMLPCYESAWEASTAADCLHLLQSAPAQMSISAGLRTLGNRDPNHSAALESSGYGMFVLINGLHSFVFRLTTEETTTLFSAQNYGAQSNNNMPSSGNLRMIMERLKHDFSRTTIDSVADDVIQSRGSPPFQELNLALNAWRMSWDNRKFRDQQSDGKNFSADPLPFWYLAKLFIVLYLVGEGRSGTADLRLPKPTNGDSKSKLLVQERIVSWLQQLGIPKSDKATQASPAIDGSMAAEEGQSQGSRVLLLMKPL